MFYFYVMSKMNTMCAVILSVLLVIVTSLTIRYVMYKDGLPILGYHHVVEDEIKEKYFKHNVYVMSVSDFEQQMRYLSDHQYHTLTMDEVYAYYQNTLTIPSKSVVLTFDDGIESFHTIVKPILEKYDLHATSFVIGRKIELNNSDNPSKYTYLRKEYLQNDEHVEYYSHTYNLHHKAGMLKKQMEVETYDFIKEDFIKNESIVEDTYFAFPYGKTSENAKQVLKERNVRLAFGYGQNRNMIKSDDAYLLPRYIMYDFMPMWLFEWIVK